jgi:hypothetical protein
MVFLTSPEGIKALSAASGDAELLVRLGGCNRRQGIGDGAAGLSLDRHTHRQCDHMCVCIYIYTYTRQTHN